MDVLLKNIGYILAHAKSNSVKSYAKALLIRIANEEGNICGAYLELVAKYINSMDPGASWSSLEILGEATKDWLVFNEEHLAPDIYTEETPVDNFEVKQMPLFQEGGEFDD